MREYKAINPYPLKPFTRIFALIAGIALILLGIFIKSVYTSLVGSIIIMAIIYKKDMSFTEEGYLTTFDFIFFRHEDLWKYSDISNLHKDPAPNKDYMGILIQKDMALKRAIVPTEYVQDILHLALEKNPNVYIDFN